MCNSVIITRLKALKESKNSLVDNNPEGWRIMYIDWYDIQEIIDEFEVKE